MRIGNEYAAKTLCKEVQACYNFSVYTEDGTNETTAFYKVDSFPRPYRILVSTP